MNFTSEDLSKSLESFISEVINPAIFALAQRMMTQRQMSTGLLTVIVHRSRLPQVAAQRFRGPQNPPL